MNNLILQIWEQSETGVGVQPDGCSLHIDSNSLNDYIKSFYEQREGEVPDVYERVVGVPIDVFVDDNIFNIVSKLKSVRLQQYEMNNLINLKEIVVDL